MLIDSDISLNADGTYKAFVLNYEKCNKLNRRLKQYRDKHKLYKFKENEEGIFIFKSSDLLKISKILGITLGKD